MTDLTSMNEFWLIEIGVTAYGPIGFLQINIDDMIDKY